MSRLVVLDNEAVQALRGPGHRKHRQVISIVDVVASRKRRAAATEVVVPAAVRVEAGWDRTSAAWAFVNRLRIADAVLDGSQASLAAAIRGRIPVSVADAHVGAVIQSATASDITVVTSDPRDMRLLAADTAINVITL